jgi:transcriptional regulator with GAF, ATPase, and Fis domain
VPLRNEKPYKLKEVERLYVLSVLAQTGGRIRGEGGASQVLGLKPTTLESRIARMGLKKGHYTYS